VREKYHGREVPLPVAVRDRFGELFADAESACAFAAAGPLGLRDTARWGTAMVLAVVILAVQAVFSRWWLTRFRYGPMEWGRRCVTWWSVVQLRRGRPEAWRGSAQAAASIRPVVLLLLGERCRRLLPQPVCTSMISRWTSK
jgi:hypothetical protein